AQLQAVRRGEACEEGASGVRGRAVVLARARLVQRSGRRSGIAERLAADVAGLLGRGAREEALLVVVVLAERIQPEVLAQIVPLAPRLARASEGQRLEGLAEDDEVAAVGAARGGGDDVVLEPVLDGDGKGLETLDEENDQVRAERLQRQRVEEALGLVGRLALAQADGDLDVLALRLGPPDRGRR